MPSKETTLIKSPKSQRVIVDGYPFAIEIYRLLGEDQWSLEVVDIEDTSHVWDEQFTSDKDARNAAIMDLELKGAVMFMRGDHG